MGLFHFFLAEFQRRQQLFFCFVEQAEICKRLAEEVMTDGSEHWVSTTKMPLVNAKGEVVGTFGISRDVTRLKKLENDVVSRDKNLNAEKKIYEDKIKSLEDQLKN